VRRQPLSIHCTLLRLHGRANEGGGKRYVARGHTVEVRGLLRVRARVRARVRVRVRVRARARAWARARARVRVRVRVRVKARIG